MKDKFITHGVMPVTNWYVYELQISEDGSMARWRFSSSDTVKAQGRWQEIRYTKAGKPFIYRNTPDHGKITLYLDDFMRV